MVIHHLDDLEGTRMTWESPTSRCLALFGIEWGDSFQGLGQMGVQPTSVSTQRDGNLSTFWAMKIMVSSRYLIIYS